MKKLILTLLPTLLLSQVGIKTTNPTATLDVNGNLRVRNLPAGTPTDSILVTSNGYIKKIALSHTTSTCPDFLKTQSSPYYLLFKSSSGISSPNNNLLISNKTFVSAGTWIQNNLYYFSWSNTSGQPLNINNFTVQFGNISCIYN
jgi:hypothetical protein